MKVCDTCLTPDETIESYSVVDTIDAFTVEPFSGNLCHDCAWSYGVVGCIDPQHISTHG